MTERAQKRVGQQGLAQDDILVPVMKGRMLF
jgi:hypothetical protein